VLAAKFKSAFVQGIHLASSPSKGRGKGKRDTGITRGFACAFRECRKRFFHSLPNERGSLLLFVSATKPSLKRKCARRPLGEALGVSKRESTYFMDILKTLLLIHFAVPCPEVPPWRAPPYRALLCPTQPTRVRKAGTVPRPFFSRDPLFTYGF
jgi:hypothetical protein